jgi:hypothetical protein
VVETGKPVPQDSALKALAPTVPDLPVPAWNLDLGVAVAVLGDDAIVDAKIGVSDDTGGFRLFRLHADPEAWLFVPKDTSLGLARLQPVAVPATGADPTLAGVTFTVSAEGDGEGEVIGEGGGSGIRPLRYRVLQGAEDAAARGLLLDWGRDRQAFAGREVHPDDVEIFGKPVGM